MCSSDLSKAVASSSTDATSTKDMAQNFLKMLTVQLQNQDPLNPMDNAQMLEQIGQIRQISATSQLTESLDAMFIGQNLATATNLIGKRVSALTDDGKNVEGLVDRVTVEVDQKDDSKRTLTVRMGDQTVQLKNVREIVNGE